MEFTSSPIAVCLVSSGTSNEGNIQVLRCQEAPGGTILGTWSFPTAFVWSPWPLFQPCHIGWRLWHLWMVVGGLHHWILPPGNPAKMAWKWSSSIGQVEWDYSKLIWKVIFKDPKDHSMDNTSSEYYSVSLRFGWARKLAPQQFAAQTTQT